MKIHEYQAKEILKKYNIPIQEGYAIENSADIDSTIKKVQAEVLENYSKIVKPGGKMVYATCSILPQENEQQVEKFLANNEEYTLITAQTLLPHITGNDGFYIAVLERRA